MKLDEFYTIEKDAHSCNLVYRKEGELNPETGKRSVSQSVTYHANLKQALVAYLHLNLANSETVADIVDQITAAEERIIKAVEEKQ